MTTKPSTELARDRFDEVYATTELDSLKITCGTEEVQMTRDW